MLVFGGTAASGRTDELWRFDPLAGATGDWVDMMPAGTLPSPRSDPGVAYDSGRGVLVLFGGRTGSGNAGINGETWEWDSGTNTWTDKTPTVPVIGTNTPAELERPMMVFEPALGRCLLFGGRGNETTALKETDETWSWDGTNWTKLAPATSPPVRRNHTMAHDPIHNVTMVWGGIAAGAALGDTWLWDGATWTQVVTATTPFANATHNGALLNTLVYDQLRDRFVLTGGTYPGGTVQTPDDTYEFDGVDWTNRGSSGIGGRYSAVAAYVEILSKTYYFSGYSGPRYNDTWEYQTNAPASFVLQPGGCAGAGAVPGLQAVTLPWLGDTAAFQATGTTAGAANFLALGLAPTAMPLAPFGFPACTAELDPIGSLLMVLDPSTGLPTASVPLAGYPSLVGVVIYTQVGSLEVGPTLQLAMSGRGDAVLGAR